MAGDHCIGVIRTVIIDNQELPLDVSWDAKMAHLPKSQIEKARTIPGANHNRDVHAVPTLQ